MLIHIDKRQREVEASLRSALASDREEGKYCSSSITNIVDLEAALRQALDSKFGLDSPMVKEVSKVLAQKRKARIQECDVKVIPFSTCNILTTSSGGSKNMKVRP